MRLGYASESDSRIDCINRRAHKLEARLEAKAEVDALEYGCDRICGKLDGQDEARGAEAFMRLAPLLVA
jgi:hypothetical protein